MNKRRRHAAKRRRDMARLFAEPTGRRYWQRFVASVNDNRALWNEAVKAVTGDEPDEDWP